MKRNPWPYAIVIYFAVFIAAMATWICFAVRNDHELVRKDYYEQELQFQTELDRAQRARAVNVNVSYDAVKNAITVQLPLDTSNGSIYFYRPARAALDKQIPIALEHGIQTIDVRDFAAGLWKVRLSWNANGNAYQHDTTIVLGSTTLSAL